MGLIDRIKNSIGFSILNRVHKRFDKAAGIPDFTKVSEIGIVYNAEKNENEERVQKVASFLRNQGKKVLTLGYFPGKELPPDKKFHINSEYFWKEKLTGFNLPDPSKIGRFMETEFDLLINLFFENELPLQAIAAYSKARYSMAANLPGSVRFNHFVIDMAGNTDIELLGIRMIDYLKAIHNQK